MDGCIYVDYTGSAHVDLLCFMHAIVRANTLALWSRGRSNSAVIFDVTPNEINFSEPFFLCSHKEHGYFHVPFLERIQKLHGIFHECVLVTSTWKFP